MGRTGPGSHAPAGNEDVKAAVVVKIGLIADEPAELVGDSGACAAIVECAVTAVSIVRHRFRGIVGGDDDVQEPVVIEIVHDRAAGLVEPIEPGFVALVVERADVELGVEETIDGPVEPRISLFRRFTEGHMSDFQKPADADVVGEELEVFAEMLDGQPRSFRIGMHGSG